MSIKIALTCFLVLVCYQHVSGRPPMFLKNDPPVFGVYDTSNITVVSCLGTVIRSGAILVSRGCSHIPVERLFILDENENPIFPIVFVPIFPDFFQDTDDTIGIMMFEDENQKIFQIQSPVIVRPPIKEEESYNANGVCYHTGDIENITSVGFTKEYPQSLVTRKNLEIKDVSPYEWLTENEEENEEENDEVDELLFGYIDRPGLENTQYLIGVNQIKSGDKPKLWTKTSLFGYKIDKAVYAS